MSLEGALSSVYQALYVSSGFQKVNRFLNIYKPDDPDTGIVREKYGERCLGELTPRVLKQDDIWKDLINQDQIPAVVRHALQDTQFHEVIAKAEPDYKFNPEQPTLGFIARLPIIQQKGLEEQISIAKKNDFKASVDVINDPKIYRKVIADIQCHYPEFLQYLSQQHYHFRLRVQDENIVKDISSIWRKADDYQPSDDNEGCSGTMGVRDGARILVAPEQDKDFTFQEYMFMRNQLCAYGMTNHLNFKMNRLKDNLGDTVLNGGTTYKIPTCNLNGLQDYEFRLNKKEAVVLRFSSEIQFCPLNKKIERDYDASLEMRGPKREGDALGVDQGYAAAQYGIIISMWDKMPYLKRAVLGQYEDVSRTVIDRYTAQSQILTKPVQTGRQYQSNKIVNLSLSNDVVDLALDPMAKIVLDRMIQPAQP